MTLLFNSFPDMGVDITQTILSVYFPILLQVGYITSIGLYLLATVQDRYDKTRYLLNFAGMRSSSYYLGIFLADFLIFMSSNVLIVISVYVLGLKRFTEEGKAFLLFEILLFFGLPYITLTYNIGFLFTKPETAFKFSILLSLLYYALPTMLLQIWLAPPTVTQGTHDTVATIINIISPFNTLNSGIQYLVDDTLTVSDKYVKILVCNFYFIMQFMVFLGLAIFWDYRIQNKFKGEDGKQQTVERK